MVYPLFGALVVFLYILYINELLDDAEEWEDDELESSKTYLSGTSFTTDIYYCVDPTYQRGTHNINRPFVFKSNPNFIFHDSPGFETGDGVTTNCHFAHIFVHIFIYRTYIRCSFIGIQLLIISQTVSPLA